MAAFIAISLFFVLMLIGVPVSIALGVAGTVTLMSFGLGAQMIGVNFIATIALFPLLAPTLKSLFAPAWYVSRCNLYLLSPDADSHASA